MGSSELWAKILLNHNTPTTSAFLTHNPEALSLRLSNPFWTLVLERWKFIQSNLYLTPTNLIHTNICNSESTNFIMHIPPYKYIPLNLITDQDLNILPKSELRTRLPLATWTQISPPSSHPKCKSQTLTLKAAHTSSMHSAIPLWIPAAGPNSTNFPQTTTYPPKY